MSEPIAITLSFPQRYIYTIGNVVLSSNVLSISVNQTPIKPTIGLFVVTWDGPNNGFSTINWNVINWIGVFHMITGTDGSLTYDVGATPINYATTVSTAHAAGASCFVCIGGYQDPEPYTAILSSASAQSALITNAIVAAQLYSYDGICVDFENVQPGDFSGTAYTTFISNLTKAAHAANLQVYVTWADWMTESVNPTTLEPVCDKLLDMIYPNGNVTTAAFEANVTSDAKYLKNPKNQLVGFEFVSDTPPSLTTTTMLPMLSYLIQNGYGAFFWEASKATSAWYSMIASAL